MPSKAAPSPRGTDRQESMSVAGKGKNTKAQAETTHMKAPNSYRMPGAHIRSIQGPQTYRDYKRNQTREDRLRLQVSQMTAQLNSTKSKLHLSEAEQVCLGAAVSFVLQSH